MMMRARVRDRFEVMSEHVLFSVPYHKLFAAYRNCGAASYFLQHDELHAS